MVNINKCIKALLHPAVDHQGSHKAHQAGNYVESPGHSTVSKLNAKFRLTITTKTLLSYIFITKQLVMFKLGPLLLTWFNFNPSMDK